MCGERSLFIIYVIIQLTQLSQDYIEEWVWNFMKKLRNKFKKPRSNTSKEENDDKRVKSNEDDEASMSTTKAKVDDDENDSKKDENQINSDVNESLSAHNVIFFHATLFMIWTLVTLINVPFVITWAHNFK